MNNSLAFSLLIQVTCHVSWSYIMSKLPWILYTGKVFPTLHKTPRHEDVWGSGGIAPRTLKLGIKWRCGSGSYPGQENNFAK